MPSDLPMPKMSITLGAKVATDNGDGIAFGIIRCQPMYYDVLMLKTGKLEPRMTGDKVRLLDTNPVDDPDVPQNIRDWLKKRPTA